MLSLIFDTETTGVPIKRRGLITDDKNWPYIVQLAWVLIDNDTGKIVQSHNYILKLPTGIVIPDEAIAVHKITNRKMKRQGVDSINVFNKFMETVKQSKYVVAHNISFDITVLRAELYRNKLFKDINIFEKSCIKFCTMKYGVPICKIKMINKYTGKEDFKWPSLTELHTKLFHQELQEDKLHDAFADVMVCLRCYWKMKCGEDLYIKNKEFSSRFNNYISQTASKY